MTRLRVLVAAALAVSCVATPENEPLEHVEQAVKCPPKLVYYPVRGKHNNGYDKTAGNSSLWSCGNANSNTDFVKGDHLGNDIWAAEGVPVVATTDGTYTLVGATAYSGTKVTIIDDCGWYHFYTHLQKLGPGVSTASNGKRVTAGTVIGYVGKTGTASNGVVHLHYSTYPDGNYDAGVDPYPYLKVVETDVCTLPGTCTPTTEVCNGKDDDCDGKIDEDGVCAVMVINELPTEPDPPADADAGPDPDPIADTGSFGATPPTEAENPAVEGSTGCQHANGQPSFAFVALGLVALALSSRRAKSVSRPRRSRV